MLEYSLSESTNVRLALRDLLGREVFSTASGLQSVGTHRLMIDGTSLAPGIYYYSLQIGATQYLGKLSIVR